MSGGVEEIGDRVVKIAKQAFGALKKGGRPAVSSRR
jgi:hypothetical protein